MLFLFIIFTFAAKFIVMKKCFLLFLFYLAIFPACGQIAVESFRLLETDLTAITNGTQETDQNNDVAALIKIVTTQQGFTFDNGMLGIVKVVQKPAEIWVYVPPKTQKLSIAHPDLGLLRDYYFQIPIESGRTYELKLVSGQVITTVKKTPTTQYLTIKVTPPDATIYIDGELQALNREGEFYKLVTIGRHTYRVEAVGYKSKAGVLNVTSEQGEPYLVNLESTLATLTLNCGDAEADIFLNGEEKGKGSWTGHVTAGLYIAEARRKNHTSTSEEIKVEELEEKTVSLNPPTPRYGSLRVESVPMGASVYVDGKEYGKTPCFIDESSKLIIGEHELKLLKEDYDTYVTTIELIEEKETKVPEIQLTQSFKGIINSSPNARLYIDGKNLGETPYSNTFHSGDYRLRLVRKGYDTFDETVHLSASNPNPVFKLQRRWFSKNSFYIGAESHLLNSLAIDGVFGGYWKNVCAELRFVYPLQASETAYFNRISDDGSIGEYQSMEIKPGSRFGGLLGYGILLGKRFRMTPAVGLQSTTLNGIPSNSSIPEQNTYVLSCLGAVKMEFALLPSLSVLVSPEYVSPLGKDDFVSTFERVGLSMPFWYSGFHVNAGIHFNF